MQARASEWTTCTRLKVSEATARQAPLGNGRVAAQVDSVVVSKTCDGFHERRINGEAPVKVPWESPLGCDNPIVLRADIVEVSRLLFLFPEPPVEHGNGDDLT